MGKGRGHDKRNFYFAGGVPAPGANHEDAPFLPQSRERSPLLAVQYRSAAPSIFWRQKLYRGFVAKAQCGLRSRCGRTGNLERHREQRKLAGGTKGKIHRGKNGCPLARPERGTDRSHHEGRPGPGWTDRHAANAMDRRAATYRGNHRHSFSWQSAALRGTEKRIGADTHQRRVAWIYG